MKAGDAARKSHAACWAGLLERGSGWPRLADVVSREGAETHAAGSGAAGGRGHGPLT